MIRCRSALAPQRSVQVIVCVSLLATLSSAQTPTTAFTQLFDWTTNKISILPSSNWGLFKADETVSITTSDDSPITVFDLYGRTVYTGAPRSLTCPAGHYFVECDGDRNQFAVLPLDYSGASFMGDIADEGWVYKAERQQRIQPGWVRTGGASWLEVQPEQGVWNWTKMDAVIANNPNRKILVIAGGLYAPDWVQPDSLTVNYATYVTALAQRYKGKIAAIEIWNEPHPLKFWDSPDWIEMLAGVIAAGKAAIKAVDSSILVVGPTWSAPNVVATERLAQFGFITHIDGLSWHDYLGHNTPPDQDLSRDDKVIQAILGRVQLLRDAARFNGPLFITEFGAYGQSALGIPYPPIASGLVATGLVAHAPDWHIGAARTAKYVVLYRAAGAEMIMPHVLSLGGPNESDGYNSLYGWDYDYRGPAPKTSAFLMSCYWLNGAQLADYRTLGERISLYAWRRPDNTSVLFAWANEGESFALSNNTSFNITDLYGGRVQPAWLSDQPILFHTNSPNAVALLQSVMAALPSLNLPPAIGLLGNQSVLKNQPLEFSVPASDPDHDPITYSASSLPSGASLNPTTGVFSWTPTPSQIGPYSVTITATDARGLSDSTATLISVLGSNEDGLVGWWKLDETTGTVAADSTGSNPGRLTNFDFAASSGWAAGKIDNGLAFDGTNSYVQLDSSRLSLSNNFTVTAWLNPRNAAGYGVIFCLRSIWSASGFRLMVSGNDLLIFGQTTTGWKEAFYAIDQIQDDTWYHLVFIYDKSSVEVYLNGVRQMPGYGAKPYHWDGDFVMNPKGVTRIGAEYGTGPVVGFFFKGIIDDVRVYNRTLTPSEVSALYQWPAPRPPLNVRVRLN